MAHSYDDGPCCARCAAHDDNETEVVGLPTSTLRTCSVCHAPLPPRARRDAVTCSGACRSVRSRRRRAHAQALLQRQTRAIIDGDAIELFAVQREAERLFG